MLYNGISVIAFERWTAEHTPRKDDFAISRLFSQALIETYLYRGLEFKYLVLFTSSRVSLFGSRQMGKLSLGYIKTLRQRCIPPNAFENCSTTRYLSTQLDVFAAPLPIAPDHSSLEEVLDDVYRKSAMWSAAHWLCLLLLVLKFRKALYHNDWL